MLSSSDSAERELVEDIVNEKMQWATDKDLLDHFGYSDTDTQILRIVEESKCNSLKRNLVYSKGWQKYLLRFKLHQDEISCMLLDPNVVEKLQAAQTITNAVNIIRQLNYIDPRDGRWVQTVSRLIKCELKSPLV